jgi:hypothetical protein
VVVKFVRVAGAASALGVLVAGAGYWWLLSSRPASLELAPATSPKAQPSVAIADPLSQTCRPPAVDPHRPVSNTAGLWVIQPGSLVGYRAHEKFVELPAPNEAVARTERVSGWLLIGIGQDGSTPQLETACVAVQLDSLRSVDQLPGLNTADRDDVVRHFLDVAEHPFAIFQPYAISFSIPSQNETLHLKLPGELEIAGSHHPVQFALDVRNNGGQVAVAGSAAVDVGGDFGIQAPQGADGFVQVDPVITLEVSLILTRPTSSVST